VRYLTTISDVLIEQDFTQVEQLNKYVWEYANFSAGKSIDMPDPKVCKYSKTLTVRRQLVGQEEQTRCHSKWTPDQRPYH